jgi:hypothetical protein
VVTVTAGKTCIISVYASPNEEIGPVLDEIEDTIQLCSKNAVVCGDFNTRWSSFTDAAFRDRDQFFLEFIVRNDLTMENTGKPTCTHQDRYTTNDYTLTRRSAIINWKVHSQIISLSDHLLITFSIEDQMIRPPSYRTTKKIDKNVLLEHLRNLPSFSKLDTAESVEQNADTLTRWISSAVAKATTETPIQHNTYWWKPEFRTIQQQLKTLNRKLHRSSTTEAANILRNERNVLRKEYRHAIRKSKEEAWRSFVDKSRPWGKPYKVITKSKTPHSTAIPQTLKTDGTLTTSDEEASQGRQIVKFQPASSVSY